MKSLCRAVPLAVAALVLAACSDSDGDTDDAADVPDEQAAEPVTLLMGSPYSVDDGLWFNPALAYFLDQVERLSGGALTIEVTAQDENGHSFGSQHDGEQQVVQAVADGLFDLAWAGTRVFDTFDVPGFAALQAPLLVDSYQLQAAIVDSDIPQRLLGELDQIGVHGLAVLAGGLRKPVGVEAPLLGPDDWAGITFQAYRSDVQAETVTTLGAAPTDVAGGARTDGIASGEIDGHEHSLIVYAALNNASWAPYVTANVNLWPETTVLLANPDRLAELSETQVAWLREAAGEAAARSAELHDVDDDLALEVCGQGARFGVASEADLAALRQAVEPVFAQLRSDELTADLLTQIIELKESVNAAPLAVPDDCTGEAPTVAAPVSDGLPPGRYTTGEVMFDAFVATLVGAGLAPADAEQFVRIDLNTSGSITIVITADGVWQEIYSFDSGPETAGWSARYQAVDEESVVLSEPGDDCAVTVRFAVEDDQLQLELVDAECPGDPETEVDVKLLSTWLYQTVPLTRVD
jgi:TRAP-type transport system periplasmic protein